MIIFGEYGMDFEHRKTEYPCPTCHFPLYQVRPSTMVVCGNPVCDQEALYIVPKDV